MDDMSSKYRFIGCVNDISQLYTSNNISIGDIYYVNDKQSLYIYIIVEMNLLKFQIQYH